MPRVDRQLLRFGRTTRRFLALTVVLGSATGLLVVGQAWLLATAISTAFVDGAGLRTLRTTLAALPAVVIMRAAVAWMTELAAHRSSAAVKSELRAALLTRAAALSTTRRSSDRSGDLAVLATTGVDALDGYFARYLPQLVLAVVVPVTVLAAVVSQDWISAAIIAVTLPLIPVFMALIGAATRHHTNRQLRSLQRLAGHFLDVVGGLPTLKVFGRSKAQVQTIRMVTDRYRRATMATLRLAFLSSLVLEVVASVAVALVAVAVGLRLLHGHLDLHTSLFLLVLAPEAYLPLRRVGTNYHASAEGLSAAEQVFAFIDRPLPRRGTRTDVPDPASAALTVDDVWVSYPGRERPALAGVSLTIGPGEVVAVTGPSGCGKSTLLNVVLGLVVADRGCVRVGHDNLADFDPDAWRRRLTWVPQRPHLFAATIGENVRLGRPEADDDEVMAAIAHAGLADLVTRLPRGLGTRLGDRGLGLSAGERQRVALARAFLRDTPLVLLDEPTANLDGATEAEVVDAVRRLAAGRTVMVVAHRPALAAIADRVVRLEELVVAA